MDSKKVKLKKKKAGLLNFLEMQKTLMTLLHNVKPKKKKQSLRMNFKDWEICLPEHSNQKQNQELIWNQQKDPLLNN